MKVKNLLTEKSKWTKGTEARRKSGHAVVLDSPKAVKWCLLGAIKYCYPDWEDRWEIMKKVYSALELELSDSITDWNDKKSRIFKEVRSLIEKADI